MCIYRCMVWLPLVICLLAAVWTGGPSSRGGVEASAAQVDAGSRGRLGGGLKWGGRSVVIPRPTTPLFWGRWLKRQEGDHQPPLFSVRGGVWNAGRGKSSQEPRVVSGATPSSQGRKGKEKQKDAVDRKGSSKPSWSTGSRDHSGVRPEGEQPPPVAPQLALDADDESEAEMGAIVIGPETTPRPSEGEEEAAQEEDADLETEAEEVEEEEEGSVKQFSPYGAGDDDDDDASEWEEREEPGASYLQEIEGENEPDWVAGYATETLDDLTTGLSEEEEGSSKYTREEVMDMLKRLWARTALTKHDFGGGGKAFGATEDAEQVDDDEVDAVNPFRRTSKLASRRLLYRAFSKDLTSDSRTMGGRHWLDKDALVHLRGQALLCQHPEYADLLSGLSPRYSRGFRLVVPTATHFMQEALAAAVAHSVGARLLVADHRRLAAVRRIALDHGVPKAWLGADVVMAALLDLVRGPAAGDAEAEENVVASGPYVVFLADRGRYFLQSKAVAEQLQQELQSKSSKTLFLLSSELDPESKLTHAAVGSSAQQQAQSPQAQPAQAAAHPLVTGSLPEGLMNGPGVNATHQHQQATLEHLGLPRGMPWPPMPPNFKGQPVLHLLIRPQVFPPGMVNPNQPGGAPPPPQYHPNGTAVLEGTMPFRQPPDLRKVIAELAERFSQMAKDRMDSAANNSNNKGEGEYDEDKEDEDEDDEDDANEFKYNRETLAQIREMLEALRNDANAQRQLNEQIQQALANLPFVPPTPGPDGQPAQVPGLHIMLMGPYPPRPGTPHHQQQQPPSPSSSRATPPPPPPATSMSGGKVGGRSWKPFEMWNQRPSGKEGADGNSAGSGSKKKRGGKASAKDGAAGAAPAADGPLSVAEAEELMSLFEDVLLNPTKDASLRARWDRIVKEDNERLDAKRNFLLLTSALKMKHMVCSDLVGTNPLLYKVQLKYSDVFKVLLAAVEVDVSTRPHLQQVSTDEGPKVVLSLSALETGLAMVCKTNIHRPGVPVSRTREEVTALAQNRHEHALVSNVISPADIGVTYSMIGGLNDVKETLRQCVTYPLKFPHLYSEGIAADSVKGVLLFGPPGTGKTMLAKAVATEGGATFLSVDASVIESKWLGESEKNAKAVFTLARRLAPCVIYLDEVDSILSSRDQGEDTKYNTITSVKTTFMQEWDGLRTTSDRVIVVASTNRPYALDQAVLRRMPRRILVDLPDLETREEMLRVIMSNNRVAPDVNLTSIAKRLEGYTGSDIREVCREAVVRIAHDESKKLEEEQQGGVGLEALSNHRLRPVTNEDFSAAMEKLSASVAAKGRELERVREWNNQFGEVRKKQRPAHLSMYL